MKASEKRAIDEDNFRGSVYELLEGKPNTARGNQLVERAMKHLNNPIDKVTHLEYLVRLSKKLGGENLAEGTPKKKLLDAIDAKLNSMHYQPNRDISKTAVLAGMGEADSKDPKVLKKADKILKLANGERSGALGKIKGLLARKVFSLTKEEDQRQLKARAEAKIMKHSAKKEGRGVR